MAATDDNPTRLTAGVLGGMGPEATVDFMAKVIALTPAERDQDHVRMVVENNPQVPDRQQAMRGDDAPVRQALTDMAMHLQSGAADFLVMPCNTAHAFIQDAIDAVAIPFVSIIDVTIDAITEAQPQTKCVGLLATNACLAAGVYQGAAAKAGLQLLLPDVDEQDRCMDLIFRVKAGDTGSDVQSGMAELAASLIRRGADAVIAGCTEIPLVLAADAVSAPLISSTEMLAKRTVDIALGHRALPDD